MVFETRAKFVLLLGTREGTGTETMKCAAALVLGTLFWALLVVTTMTCASCTVPVRVEGIPSCIDLGKLSVCDSGAPDGDAGEGG